MNQSQQHCFICTFGAPILKQKAHPITLFDEALSNQAKKMLQLMYLAKGIGLAAPQIGISTQLIVIDLQLKSSPNSVKLDGREIPLALTQPFCFCNPSFDPVNDIQIEAEEGCLSLPDLRGTVKRYYEILLKYQDLDGSKHTLQCSDLFARCIQHECDHLQGILFIDRMSKIERRENKTLLNEIKALGGTFDYMEALEQRN